MSSTFRILTLLIVTSIFSSTFASDLRGNNLGNHVQHLTTLTNLQTLDVRYNKLREDEKNALKLLELWGTKITF